MIEMSKWEGAIFCNQILTLCNMEKAIIFAIQKDPCHAVYKWTIKVVK